MSTNSDSSGIGLSSDADASIGRLYWYAILFVTLAAAIPRFYELGSPGFYGDEETTAYPARALYETGSAEMPSGMPYHRALPLTWLNSLSAGYFGVDREFSYRFPAAILGTLTVPLLFAMARPFVGVSVALVAAVLIAFSEWHIVTSREARMYVPFLFFYFAAAMSMLMWARSGASRYLLVAAAMFAAAATLHQLALMIVLIVVIPALFAGWSRVGQPRLLVAASIAGIGAWVYGKFFVASAFRSWLPAQPERSSARPLEIAWWLPDSLAMHPFWIASLMIIGAVLGLICVTRMTAAARVQSTGIRSIAIYMTGIATGSLACIGQLYGACLGALVFLYLCPENRRMILKSSIVPLVLIASISTIVAASTVVRLGPAQGVRALAGFPFPYPAFFAEMFPIVFLLFIAGAAYIGLQVYRAKDDTYRVFALAAIFPIAAIGAVSRWEGIRYLFGVYPFLLLIASAVLYRLLEVLGARFGYWSETGSIAIAVALSVSGILGGHGIPQAVAASRVEAGSSVSQLVYGYSLYPDHRSAGEFVRSRLSAGDVVIAEDPLQQRWYAGQVDFWFRNPERARPYLYTTTDGVQRDRYVNSRLVEDTDMLASIVDQERSRKVWYITSAETYSKKGYYFSSDQLTWLHNLEDVCEPEFIGQDAITKVYCVSCCAGQLDINR